MPVYVDPLFDHGEKGQWSHLTGEPLEELHAFANRLGLHRAWFQPRSIPHYDIPPIVRDRAIQLGAIPLERKPFLNKVRELKQRWLLSNQPQQTPPGNFNQNEYHKGNESEGNTVF